MKNIFIFIVLLTNISFGAMAQLVYKDVAGIFYNRCTKCHHQGGGAPFSMMNYSETSPWSSLIQTDLNSGKMPVWPPDTLYTRFLHERIITASEKNAILSWLSSGSQKGDTTIANGCPAAPVYPKYQLYGTPSLVLQIPTFTSNASTTDAYNCFSLATGLTQDRWIRAYEIVPGNPGIVHHVVVSVDTVGNTTNNLSGTCYNQPGDFEIGGYAPGAGPTVFPGQAPLKTGMRIKAGSKIVLQLHYPAGSAGQQDSTQIRLYFYPVNETGVRPIYSTVPLQNWSLFLPANTTTTFTAQYPSSGGLPVAISLFATFPHSHNICTNLVNYADNGINTIPIIRINKWDINWEGYYTFPNLVKIPTGYTLRASHSYDNTTNNPRNPNNPPILVTAGLGTNDEMLFDAFQWLYYLPGDELIDIKALLANDSLLSSINEPLSQNIQMQTLVYPNPSNGIFQIQSSEKGVRSLEIVNLLGKKVYSTIQPFNNSTTIDLSSQPKGIYFIRITSEQGTATKKLIIQ